MPTQSRFLVMALAMIWAAPLAFSAQAQDTRSRVQPVPPKATIALREPPAEMTRRFTVFHSALQPSAKAWVEQQARAEARKAAPDLPALESAIRKRFPDLKARSAAGATSDIDALIFLVMMQAAQDMNEDLKSMMERVKAIDAAKQTLRELIRNANAEVARSARNLHAPCRSPFCQSLPAKLGALATATAALPHPVRVSSPAQPTYAQLRALQGRLKADLDSMNELNEMESLRLQMAMDRRSKFMQALSNILKKTSDTQASIVQNLK
jgi:hypothetical protein